MCERPTGKHSRDWGTVSNPNCVPTWGPRLAETARVESWAPCGAAWCAVRAEGSGVGWGFLPSFPPALPPLPRQPPGGTSPASTPHRHLLGGRLLGQVEARGLGWGLDLFSQGGLLGWKIAVGGSRHRTGHWQTGELRGGHAAVRDRRMGRRVPLPLGRREDIAEKQAAWGVAPYLGEAGSAAPRGVVGVWEHPFGGLIVLGELQGGSRFMTRRPQAAMLRFIWDALRKS